MRTPLLLLLPLGLGCEPVGDTGAAPPPHSRACAYHGVGGMLLDAADTLEFDSLATIEVSDEPWTIGLDPGSTHYLRFELAQAAQLWLYADQAGVINELYRYDGTLGLDAGEPVTQCPDDLPEHFELVLTAGTYHLELAPTEGDSLWLMLMENE